MLATTVAVETPSGTATALLQVPDQPVGLLILGHGSSGGVEAPDLLAAEDAAVAAGFAVARVLQPYRVRGNRVAPPAPRLDEAWHAVTAALRRRRSLRGVPVVHGGRSAGARVACRCANDLGAAGVVALAFPLHPPGRPDRSRLPELAAVAAPVLVVQGDRDPFGCPPAEVLRPPGRLVVVPGDHSMRRSAPLVRQAVGEFLSQLTTL